MSQTKSINLHELRVVVNRLFDHLIDEKKLTSVTLTKSMYWNIPTEQIYDVANSPTDLDIGSLTDDWEFIKSLLKPDAEPVTLQFTELAPLLRFIGEVIEE
jgi:hypothetical protein